MQIDLIFPLWVYHLQTVRREFPHSGLLIIEVWIDICGLMKNSMIGLELLWSLIAVSIQELWMILFGAFGLFFVSAIV